MKDVRKLEPVPDIVYLLTYETNFYYERENLSTTKFPCVSSTFSVLVGSLSGCKKILHSLVFSWKNGVSSNKNVVTVYICVFEKD